MKPLVLSEPSRPARSASDPDPEILAKARRRTFTTKYKLDTLKEADACTESGEIGALLRRKGLYSSHLTNWRRQRDEGVLAGLTPKKRGRKARKLSAEARRVAELEREVALLRRKLAQAETIIEVQKKLSQLLGSQEEESP